MKARIRVCLPSEWAWLLKLSPKARNEILAHALRKLTTEEALQMAGIRITDRQEGPGEEADSDPRMRTERDEDEAQGEAGEVPSLDQIW